MDKAIIKIVTALDSTQIIKAIELKGYVVKIAKMDNWSDILNSNVSIAVKEQLTKGDNQYIDKIADFIISKVFNTKMKKFLVQNNICMLVYSQNTSSTQKIDITKYVYNVFDKVSPEYISIDNDIITITVHYLPKYKKYINDNKFSLIHNINLDCESNIKDIKVIYDVEVDNDIDELGVALLDAGFIFLGPKENELS